MSIFPEHVCYFMYVFLRRQDLKKCKNMLPKKEYKVQRPVCHLSIYLYIYCWKNRVYKSMLPKREYKVYRPVHYIYIYIYMGTVVHGYQNILEATFASRLKQVGIWMVCDPARPAPTSGHRIYNHSSDVWTPTKHGSVGWLSLIQNEHAHGRKKIHHASVCVCV